MQLRLGQTAALVSKRIFQFVSNQKPSEKKNQIAVLHALQSDFLELLN
jgi:hypothetical protein